MQAILYTFSFDHHGKYSSFHRLSNYLSDQVVVDATLRLPYWLPDGVKWRVISPWRKYSEYRLWPYYRSSHPCIFHYLYPENSLHWGWKWKRHHKLILTCHQPVRRLEQMKGQGEMFAGFFQGMAVADVIVVLSETQASGYQQLATQANVILIPHGVDTDYFQPDPVAVRRLRILTIGNWLRDYQCWAAVVRRVTVLCPDVEFVVIANPYTTRWAQAELGTGNARVCYLSGISDNALHRLYQQASVMFLPLTDAVANNALLEAMAMGLPIVVSDLPATREYLGEQTGVLIRDSDVEGYAQSLVALLSDSSLCAELGRRARARAEEHYTWNRIADRYRSLYHSLHCE